MRPLPTQPRDESKAGFRLKYLVPACLLWLAGCAAPWGSNQPKTGAALPGPGAGLDASTGNKEIRCHLQMIDGVEAGSGDRLRPGHHRVIVALGGSGDEHVGDVDLLIPGEKNYGLKAERNEEAFMLSLIELETGKVAATSAALAGQVMKFKVFVSQR